MKMIEKAAMLKRLELKKDRRGYTLLEAVLTLAVASMLIYGLAMLAVATQEQLHVNSRIRAIEEWAHAYTQDFGRIVRNADSLRITRQTAPCEMKALYWTRDLDMSSLRRVREYRFRYDSRSKLPELLRDNREILRDGANAKQYLLSHFSSTGDRRDNFETVRTGEDGFLIYDGTNNAHIREDIRDGKMDFRKNFMTMSFTIEYTREGTLPGQGNFKKKLYFTQSAYARNTNWPIEDAGMFGGGGGEE